MRRHAFNALERVKGHIWPMHLPCAHGCHRICPTGTLREAVAAREVFHGGGSPYISERARRRGSRCAHRLVPKHGSQMSCDCLRKSCGNFRGFRGKPRGRSYRGYGACKGDSLPIHPSGVTACQPLVCVKSLQKSVHGKMDTLCASSGAIWRGPCRLLCVPAVGVQHIGVHPDRRGHSTAYSRFPLSQADPGGPCILYIPHMGGFSRFRVTSRG